MLCIKRRRLCLNSREPSHMVTMVFLFLSPSSTRPDTRKLREIPRPRAQNCPKGIRRAGRPCGSWGPAALSLPSRLPPEIQTLSITSRSRAPRHRNARSAAAQDLLRSRAVCSSLSGRRCPPLRAAAAAPAGSTPCCSRIPRVSRPCAVACGASLALLVDISSTGGANVNEMLRARSYMPPGRSNRATLPGR